MVEQYLIVPDVYIYMINEMTNQSVQLTLTTSSNPSRSSFHPMVRIVARNRLGFSGFRLISSNQLASSVSVSVVDSR